MLLRPKREFEGGGPLARKVANAATQLVWTAERHTGMDLKVPPTSLPSGTLTFAPNSSADTMRCCSGRPSMSRVSSSISMRDPCEWPISTTPRPWLSWFR